MIGTVLAAAGLAASLAPLARTEVAAAGVGRFGYVVGHGLGGVALGNRIYAFAGGVAPGFSFSRAAEVLDVP